jgi:hypothetical protein
LKNIAQDTPKEITVLEDAFKDTESKVYDLLPAFYSALGARVKSVEAAVATKTWDSIESLPESPVGQCNIEIAAIDILAC